MFHLLLRQAYQLTPQGNAADIAGEARFDSDSAAHKFY